MDIYTALHKDHEEVRELLDRLVRTTEINQDTSDLLARIRDALIPHARAEEEVFYNSIRQIASDRDLVMHGFREHLEAETLLRTLQGMAMIGVEWTAAAEKLRDAVNHHIQDEETKIFPQAKRLFDQQEAEQIGAAFQALKPEVRQEGAVTNMIHMVRNMMPPRLQGEQQQPPQKRRRSA
jgi:hemerythrin superfamily protein